MKQFIFSFLFSVLFLSVNAQSTTTKWIYQLDHSSAEMPQAANQKEVFKLKSTNINRIGIDEYLLGLTLEKAILSGQLSVYKDEKCQEKYTIEEAQTLMEYNFTDTIISFDPVTFREEIKIVRKEIPRFPIKETIYELSQSWQFDAQSGQVNMSVDAIHIGHLELLDSTLANDLNHKQYLFSIKMNDLKPILSNDELLQANIIWAKEIHYNGTFSDKKITELLLSYTYLSNHKIISTVSQYEFTKEEIKNIHSSTDTIITFDPETFKEEMKIVFNKLELKNLKSFIVAQDFYFDIETNSLRSRVLAIAPVMKFINRFPPSISTVPIFWIVYDDDFLKRE